MVADGTQADDPRALRSVELVIHIDHLRAIDLVQAPMVKAIASRLGADVRRHRDALGTFLGDRSALHAGRQQCDSLGQGGDQTALKHGGRHFFVAVKSRLFIHCKHQPTAPRRPVSFRQPGTPS